MCPLQAGYSHRESRFVLTGRLPAMGGEEGPGAPPAGLGSQPGRGRARQACILSF